MIKQQISTLLSVSIILISSIICASCSKKSPESTSPGEKINAMLNLVDENVKRFGIPKDFANIANDDTLKFRVVYEWVKVKSNSIGKIAVTEKCLKERRDDDNNNSEAYRQFKNDSTYLSLLELKTRELDKQLHEKGDPSVLDVVLGIEKTKLLIAEMNSICPTVGELFE